MLFTLFIFTVLLTNVITYHVSLDGGAKAPYESWKNAAITIQSAVTALNKKDTNAIVKERKGVYKTSKNPQIVLKSGLIILQEETKTSSDVIIDAEGEHRKILVRLTTKKLHSSVKCNFM